MRILKLLLLFIALPLLAENTCNVTWTFSDFNLNSQAVKRVTQTPVAPFGLYSNTVLASVPQVKVSSGGGSVTFSNTVSGYVYQVRLDVGSSPLVLTCGIPASVTGNINGADPTYLGVLSGTNFYTFTAMNSNTVISLIQQYAPTNSGSSLNTNAVVGIVESLGMVTNTMTNVVLGGTFTGNISGSNMTILGATNVVLSSVGKYVVENPYVTNAPFSPFRISTVPSGLEAEGFYTWVSTNEPIAVATCATNGCTFIFGTGVVSITPDNFPAAVTNLASGILYEGLGMSSSDGFLVQVNGTADQADIIDYEQINVTNNFGSRLVVNSVEVPASFTNRFLYVDPQGNDNFAKPGPFTPWASLAQAFSQASVGDTVILSPGHHVTDTACNLPYGVNLSGAGQGVSLVDSLKINGKSLVERFTCLSQIDCRGSNNIVSQVETISPSDGIILSSDSFGNYFEACQFHSYYDTFVNHTGTQASNVVAAELHNCRFQAFYHEPSSPIQRGIVNTGGIIRVVGGSIEVADGPQCYCVVVNSSLGNVGYVELTGVQLLYHTTNGVAKAVYYGQSLKTNTVTAYGRFIKTNDVSGGVVNVIGD